jgi:hypothetical protein
VLGLAGAALVIVSYAAIAVHGLRALEHQLGVLDPLDTARRTASVQVAMMGSADFDAERVQQGNTALAAEHAQRLERLLHQCRRTLAIDPGVRRLRARVCAILAADAAALRADPLNPRASPDRPGAEHALSQKLDRWRLRPSRSPAVAVFTAADDVKRRLSTYADVPIGARLLVLRGSILEVVDIDRSTTTRISSRAVVDAAVVGDWIVAAGEDGVFAIDIDDRTRTRRILPGMAVVVPSPDRNTVWIGLGESYIELDREGRYAGSGFSPDEGVLVAATSRYLITSSFPQDGSPSHSTLWDATTRRRIRTLPGAIMAAHRDVVVWQDEGRTVHTEGPMPVDPQVFPVEAAAVNRDATRVAVVGGTPGLQRLSATALDGSLVSSFVQVRQFSNRVVWSADGRWVFASDESQIQYASADDLKAKVLRRSRTSFTTLLGAF